MSPVISSTSKVVKQKYKPVDELTRKLDNCHLQIEQAEPRPLLVSLIKQQAALAKAQRHEEAKDRGTRILFN